MRDSAPAADFSECMGNEQPHRPRPKRRRARGQAPDGTPVVRLDIYASSEGVGARQVPAPEPRAPKAADTGEDDRRRAELDERERALAARESELDRNEATIVARAQGLDERDSRLSAREAELDRNETTLVARARGLDEREQALAAREGELAQVHS